MRDVVMIILLSASRAALAIVATLPLLALGADVDREGRSVAPSSGANQAGTIRALPPARGWIAKLYADDVDTVNDLAYQGKRLFLTDLVRHQTLSCTQYCSVAVRQSLEGRLRASIRSGSKALHLANEEKQDTLFALAKRDLASAYNFAGRNDTVLRLVEEAIEHQSRARLAPNEVLMPLLQIRGDVYARMDKILDVK